MTERSKKLGHGKPEMEKKTRSNSKRQWGNCSKMAELWSVQCGECFKWRLIPTEEEFEDIRSKFIEDPFFCSKLPGISCDVPSEIEMDNTRTWVIHKPNTPKTPVGFKRRLVIRKDLIRSDIYYDTPNGKSLRSKTEVPKLLDDNPHYSKNVSPEDFCFARPKIMEDTLPPNLPSKGEES